MHLTGASSVGEAWNLGLLYRGRSQRSALLSPPKFKKDISPLRKYQKVCFFGLLSTRKQPYQLLQNKTFYPNKPSLTIGVQANNVTISVKRFHVFSRPGVQDCVWKKMSYYRERSPEEHKRKISCRKDADESMIEGTEKWAGQQRWNRWAGMK